MGFIAPLKGTSQIDFRHKHCPAPIIDYANWKARRLIDEMPEIAQYYSANNVFPVESISYRSGKKIILYCSVCGSEFTRIVCDIHRSFVLYGTISTCVNCSWRSRLREKAKNKESRERIKRAMSPKLHLVPCTICGQEFQEPAYSVGQVSNVCQKCGGSSISSSTEIRLRQFLAIHGKVSLSHYIGTKWPNGRKMEYDAVMGNLIVELDGAKWHSLEDRVRRDLDKTRAALDAGYYVVRIRETTDRYKVERLPLSHPHFYQIMTDHVYGLANIADLAELAVSAGLNMGASFEPQEEEYGDGINWNTFKPWSYTKWDGEPPVKRDWWLPSEDELLLESDLDLNDQDDLDWFCWMTGRRHCEVFERAMQLGIASGL